MPNSCREQIEEAIETRQFVRIRRRFEDTVIPGTATYPIKQITRFNFGGVYEDALALVGGAAPTDAQAAGASAKKMRAVKK